MDQLGLQVDVSVRLLIAAVLGALIGLEREIHGHPAGMRTHLLLSLGSALFTVLSIFGFPTAEGAPLDPSRVAAQIVSGIGFLGAGAIIKDGLSIRGLTTAASLWAAAAVGMAAGAQLYLLGAVATGIIVFSLWPLNRIGNRVHGAIKDRDTLQLELGPQADIADIAGVLTKHGVEIVRFRTDEADNEAIAEVTIRTRGGSDLSGALNRIRAIDGVVVLDEGTRARE